MGEGDGISFIVGTQRTTGVYFVVPDMLVRRPCQVGRLVLTHERCSAIRTSNLQLLDKPVVDGGGGTSQGMNGSDPAVFSYDNISGAAELGGGIVIRHNRIELENLW